MVKLNEKYALKADRFNYMVVRFGVNKKGEPTEEVEGFVANLSQAVDLIYRIETREYIVQHDVELKEALVAFKELKDEILEWGEQSKRELKSINKEREQLG